MSSTCSRGTGRVCLPSSTVWMHWMGRSQKYKITKWTQTRFRVSKIVLWKLSFIWRLLKRFLRNSISSLLLLINLEKLKKNRARSSGWAKNLMKKLKRGPTYKREVSLRTKKDYHLTNRVLQTQTPFQPLPWICRTRCHSNCQEIACWASRKRKVKTLPKRCTHASWLLTFWKFLTKRSIARFQILKHGFLHSN